MLKKTLIGGSLIVAATLSQGAWAHDNAAAAALLGIGIGAAIASSGPVYAAPPVYYSAPPVYYAPPPVVYRPAPVYFEPAPVIYYGGGWGHHRGWREHEWREHHRDWR